MAKKSAGILMYRFRQGQIEFLLVHPGGPFWAKKDAGAWSIPKGEFDNDDAMETAKREFLEETGTPVDGEMMALAPQKQHSGKIVYAWALEGNLEASKITSNTFELEWPPKSGQKQAFPEVDRAEWFSPGQAVKKINPGQVPFISEIMEKLGLHGPDDTTADGLRSDSPQLSLL